MNNTQLAIKFANGEKEGKGNSMFIEDDAIFSFGKHFPIAVRVGHGTYLFNNGNYGSSFTSRHKSEVSSALKGCELISASTNELQQAIRNNVAVVVRYKDLDKDGLKVELLSYYKGKGVNTLKAKNHIKRFFDEMDRVELLYTL